MRQGWVRLLWAFISSFFLFALTPAGVFAAAPDQNQKDKTRAPGADESDSETEIDDFEGDDLNESILDDDQSATERITNAGSVQLGAGWRKAWGPDFRLGWHLDENKLVEVRFGQSKSEDYLSSGELKINTLLIQGKFFMGNSLFMGIGTGWSQMLAQHNDSMFIGGEEIPFKYESQVDQYLLNLSMGNQWQFGSWTLGLEWLNLFMPVATESKGEFSMEGGELLRLNIEQNLKAEAWEVDYGVAFYLGYVW